MSHHHQFLNNGKPNGNSYLPSHKLSNENGTVKELAFSDYIWQLPTILEPSAHAKTRIYVLISFSAHDDTALEINFGDITKRLNDYELSDLVYSLSHFKSNFSRRGFIVEEAKRINNQPHMESLIRGEMTGPIPRRSGFIFTGQVAQWSTIGSRLINKYGVFKEMISYLDSVLSQLSSKHPWTIIEALQAPSGKSRINEPLISQTVCTAL